MEPDKLLTAISLELDQALETMAAVSSLEEKKVCSEIVRNLSQSLGVFFQAATGMMDLDIDGLDDDLFDDDDAL